MRHLAKFRERVGWAARVHPFLLSLVVLLLVVTPAFVRIEQVQRQSCERANEARRDQIALWSYIITATARPNQTAQQRQVVIDFKAQLNDIFAPRQCGGW